MQERKHRINRKGRPKSFDAFRELAQQIAHEEAQSRDAQTGELVPVVIAGRKVTTAELVLRKWFQSEGRAPTNARHGSRVRQGAADVGSRRAGRRADST